MIKRFLFETATGMILLGLFELFTGCMIVPIDDIDNDFFGLPMEDGYD